MLFLLKWCLFIMSSCLDLVNKVHTKRFFPLPRAAIDYVNNKNSSVYKFMFQ